MKWKYSLSWDSENDLITGKIIKLTVKKRYIEFLSA